MIDFLTNPWVIIVIVLSVIIGNIALVKYTANSKFDPQRKNELDRLNALDKQRHPDKKDTKDE